MVHEIKIGTGFADAVESGEKTFEIRRNDRGYQRGDTVVFQVIDSEREPVEHPLNGREFLITYLLHGWGLRDGFCVFGIQPVDLPRCCED